MRCALRTKFHITIFFDLLTVAPPPPPSEKRTDAPAYGMALYNTRYYTDKTLKLREIYEYASELKFFDIFTIQNCYFLHHYVGTADTFLSVSN